MPDRCPLCHRPALSDLDYWHGGGAFPGCCIRQGSPDCDEAREERVRRMAEVCEAARDYRDTLAARAARPWAGPCEAVTVERHVTEARAGLIAALLALDGGEP